MLSIRCNSHLKSWRDKKIPQRIPKIKPFIIRCNWKGINLPSQKHVWGKCEKNLTIALNILYAKTEKNTLFMFENITQIVKKKLFF